MLYYNILHVVATNADNMVMMLASRKFVIGFVVRKFHLADYF